MKVVGNSVIINNMNKVRNLFKSTPKPAVLQEKAEQLSYEKILEILRKADNFVEPAKRDFDSTKTMFEYAKQRCIETLKSKNSEHAIIMNTKTNKVLGEFIGDSQCVPMSTFNDLNIDKSDIVVMHGHPKNFPLSYADVSFLRDTGIKSIIAVDINGEFSFVGRKYGLEKPKSKIGLINLYNKKSETNREKRAFLSYSATSCEDAEFFRNAKLEEGWKCAIHDTLKTYIPSMNLRYVTNYDYLKNTKK